VKTRVLRRSQWVPRPLEEVFPFFARPENLAALTPPDLGFRILTPSPVPMSPGSLIDYAVRPFGAPVRWRTLIESFDPPQGFVDRQLKGPYSVWRHVHRFESRDGGTLLTDEVTWAAGLGPLGGLAAPFVERELARIFDFREAAAARLLAPRPGGRIMDIVVAGGTGFIGRALVRRLSAAGHKTAVLTRRPRKAELPPGVEALGWDGEWRARVARADAVVNLCGEGVADRPWTSARRAALRDSRLEPTRALAGALRAGQALINASAVGFYGTSGPAADEGSPKGNGFLADLCERWEAEALKAEAKGVRVVRLRIGVVLGRGGGALGRMLLPFKLGLGGRLGAGSQWLPWIHEDDVVGLIEAALSDERWAGPVNAAAPGAVDNAGFTRALAAALRRPAVIPVPGFALRLALGEMSTLLLDGRRVLPKAAQDRGYAFKFPEIGDALRQLTR